MLENETPPDLVTIGPAVQWMKAGNVIAFEGVEYGLIAPDGPRDTYLWKNSRYKTPCAFPFAMLLSETILIVAEGKDVQSLTLAAASDEVAESGEAQPVEGGDSAGTGDTTTNPENSPVSEPTEPSESGTQSKADDSPENGELESAPATKADPEPTTQE